MEPQKLVLRVTGEEAFEFAAAVAGVSVGLAAVVLLAVIGVIGAWQLFRRANEASAAAARAALGAEELARHVSTQLSALPRQDGGQMTDLRRQSQELLEQQRQLHEMTQDLLEGSAAAGVLPGPAPDWEAAMGRLEATVGDMAVSLANLVQAVERADRERAGQ
jgi:hypothetical protein